MTGGRDAGRDVVLRRIRAAIGAPPGQDLPDASALPRGYRTGSEPDGVAPDLVELFATRVRDYGAGVHRVRPHPGEPADPAVALTVAALLAKRQLGTLVVPAGFPAQWLPEGGLPDSDRLPDGHGRPAGDRPRVLGDVPALAVATLDAAGAVLTTAAVGIAETGTLVLDGGPGQGRRALSLVPDWHICVLRVGQIVAGVPEGLAAVDPRRPLTFVSGPSATSDIELNRVEGVHGPRTLDVVLVN